MLIIPLPIAIVISVVAVATVVIVVVSAGFPLVRIGVAIRLRRGVVASTGPIGNGGRLGQRRGDSTFIRGGTTAD